MAPLSAPCVVQDETFSLWMLLFSWQTSSLGQERTQSHPSISESLGQGSSIQPWQMVRGSSSQRARPPMLNHRARSEEHPEGLLCHKGLWKMLSSLFLIMSRSSSSPSRTAAARANKKYSVAS